MVTKSNTSNGRSFIFLVGSIAALAGLLFGYDTGVISGARLFIEKHFHLTTIMVEVVVSAVLLGAVLGAIGSGRLADRYGRRNMMMVAAIAFIIGTLISALTVSVLWLIIGRLIVGIAIGIASYAAPLYLSEVAPKQHRGALVILNTIMVTAGIVMAYIVDLALAPSGSWRWMFAIGIFPAIMLGVGVLFLPDSPRWLAKKGMLDLAKVVLLRIRHGQQQVEQELSEIEKNIQSERSARLRDLWSPMVRPLIILGIGLAIIQQITGINTLFYYAPTIFKLAGFQSITSELLATLGLGLTNFALTIIAMMYVDQAGRRRLLLIGLAVMTVSLFAVAVSFNFVATIAIFKYIAVLSLVIFVASYALSIGCLFWLIISEIYPLNIRGVAMSVGAMSNWIANLIIALTFLTLIQTLGPRNTFILYGIAGILSWVFCYCLVPETKQVSLEQIEVNLRAGKRTRDLGLATHQK